MNFLNRLALCVRILRAKPGNLMAHAVRELPPVDGDKMQAHMNRGLLEMLLVFGTQGHSGFSAGYARSALDKLLAYKPLGPLTGEPSEWVEVGPAVYQNNRCGHVFKQADRFDGQAYDLDGVVFRDPDGGAYTNAKTQTPITFPYVPTTRYVDVDGNGEPIPAL